MSSSKDDDLYEDFNYSIEIENATASAVSFAGIGGNIPASRGPKGAGVVPGVGNRPVFSRAGVVTSLGDARPMTSISGAGYQSATRGAAFDPLKQGKAAEVIDITKKPNASSPLEVAKDMERQIHKLLEESADFGANRDLSASLDRAKEAGKRERALCRHKEQNNMSDSIDVDLTYAVCFNLADCYYKNKQYEESLSTYSLIIKSKLLASANANNPELSLAAVRVRINMGNIYYDQKKYPSAIKMYRMALDPLPPADYPVLKSRIMNNIGICFVQMGQYQDAILSFDSLLTSTDHPTTSLVHAVFNLLLCYHCLGEEGTCKQQLSRLIDMDGKMKEEMDDVDGMILVSCRLVADMMITTHDDDDEMKKTSDIDAFRSAYDWILSTIKSSSSSSSSLDVLSSSSSSSSLYGKIEMDYALELLKRREFDQALLILKSFHDKHNNDDDDGVSTSLKSASCINLSFLYFLEGDYTLAEDFANIAMMNDRYSAKALVNKGNCLFVKYEKLTSSSSSLDLAAAGDILERAKELYLEAIGVEADCMEAIYNLGLVYKRQGNASSAKQAFDKLFALNPKDIEVQLQLALLYESVGNNGKAIKWLEQVHAHLPHPDPYISARLGQVCSREDDDAQAFHWHLISHKIWPIDLDVISWLGVWYVRNEMFERAADFFIKAAIIQPNEVKWRLMIASCYRRADNLKTALEIYINTLTDFAENLECLKYIVSISREIGRPCREYMDRLDRLAPGSVSTLEGGGNNNSNNRNTATTTSGVAARNNVRIQQQEEGGDDVDVGALLE